MKNHKNKIVFFIVLLIVLVILNSLISCAVTTCPTYAEDGTIIKEEKILVATPNHPKPLEVGLVMVGIITFVVIVGTKES